MESLFRASSTPGNFHARRQERTDDGRTRTIKQILVFYAGKASRFRSAPIAIRHGKTDNVLINGNFTPLLSLLCAVLTDEGAARRGARVHLILQFPNPF